MVVRDVIAIGGNHGSVRVKKNLPITRHAAPKRIKA
jgi:hypothetical protein